MTAPRPFATVTTIEQWGRAAYVATALETGPDAVVSLARPLDPPNDAPAPLLPPAGLAFDAECRLYHTVPEASRVERLHWATLRDAPVGTVVRALDVFAPSASQPVGDFSAAPAPSASLRLPQSVCVDGDDRLFIAERGSARIRVVDLWSSELLRVASTLPGNPIDLAAYGRRVFALLDDPPVILELSAREGPDLTSYEIPPGASRIAASPTGRLVLLIDAGTDGARVIDLDGPTDAIVVPRATDIEFESDDLLVVARSPGEDLRRFQLGNGEAAEALPLTARQYDGRGIVRTPDGRIGYWTEKGFRHAVLARPRYVERGTVTTFQLDSGDYQTTWGRVFVDACIPEGTSVRVNAITLDELTEEATLPWTPPSNMPSARLAPMTPPLPPLSLVPDETSQWQRLHQRESGRELPWTQLAADDPYQTYEAPIDAPPGRYLWLTMELCGTTHQSPRVRSIRAEFPSHDYLRRLPRVFSRDRGTEPFLRRFLAMFEGFLGEVEGRAELRSMLLHPCGTPEDALPWLASFVGLVLDERWPVRVRRTLIKEAVPLFRFRGTLGSLQRMLEVFLGGPVIIIERFRLRGLGGAILGEAGTAFSRSVLGAGFRVGGAVGDDTSRPLEGTPADAFETHAHRFAVIIPSLITEEQLSVVQRILDVHRPAHTLVEICTVGAGMRVGVGLHLALSSVIGRTGGFDTIRLGSSTLGRAGIVGRPGAGGRAGALRLGTDSRVG